MLSAFALSHYPSYSKWAVLHSHVYDVCLLVYSARFMLFPMGTSAYVIHMFVSLVLAVPWICNTAYCSQSSTSQMWQQHKGREPDYSTSLIQISIYTHSMLVLCAWTNNHFHEKLHHLQCPVTSESSYNPFLIWMLHKLTTHIQNPQQHVRDYVETTEHNATKPLLVNAAVAQQGLECITAGV